MAIGELFEFDSDAYKRKISSPFYADAELAANIIRKRRNRNGAACGVCSSVGVAFVTFGASAITGAASCRSYGVASQKLDILEAEWAHRGHAKMPVSTMRDRVLPGMMGAATLGLNSLIGSRSMRKAQTMRRKRANSDSHLGGVHRSSYDDSVYERTLVHYPSLQREASFQPPRERDGTSRYTENITFPLPTTETRSAHGTTQAGPQSSDDAPPYSAPASYPANGNADTKTNNWNEEYWRQDPFIDQRAPAYTAHREGGDRSASSPT